ncbi:hypothetical protein BD413DRAFT_547127 [Trametes elegans]|nr:hypothetical protein BD413DRAFT_547127 [Trametes elegans]
MTPNASPALSVPDYHRQYAVLNGKWADIIKNDPRRACRLLLLTSPQGEMIDGDVFSEIGLLFHELKSVSRQSTSRLWRGLVDAGIVTALCKSAINSGGSVTMAHMTIHDDGTAELSEEAMEEAQENAPAPYTAALEVICNAAMSCAVPPTATEQKMIEELKKHWSTLMQRIWSEPARTLEPGSSQMRVMERAVVAQLVHRLAFVDPTFLDVIVKPSDLTLAVSFRNWLYSTDEYDTMANCSLVSPLLDGSGPKHWLRHFQTHPPPDLPVLLPRILLGASRGAEKKKRTPNQSADLIVSAFGRHIQMLPRDRHIREEFIFFSGLLKIAEQEYPLFCRALYRSEAFWTAIAETIKKHATLGPNAPRTGHVPEGVATQALSIYFSVLHTPEGRERIDQLIYNWLAGGLFDALESTILTILRDIRGPMLISAILSTMDTNLPKLSPRTRSKLRSELPRPRIMLTLILLATKGRQEPEVLLALVTEGEEVMQSQYSVRDPRHPVWTLTAWQLLLRVTNSLRPWRGTCTRRGCEKPVHSGGCGRCRMSAYCDQECMQLDQEHALVCKWTPTLLLADAWQRRNKEEIAALLSDDVAPAVPSDLVPPKEQLERLRASAEMTDEEVEKVHELQQDAEATASKEEDPIPGVPDLQKAMEKLVVSEPGEA